MIQKKIGVLKTTSGLVTSRWGDETLFFKHNYMDEDLKDNPQWEKYTPKFSIFGGSTTEVQPGEQPKAGGCPFLH